MLEMLRDMRWTGLEVEALSVATSIVADVSVILIRPDYSSKIVEELVDRGVMGLAPSA